MGELSPVVEGHLKIRDGKKWKNRFARITRLSPVADFLTLQLWKDGKEVEKHAAPTKGSLSLCDYLGVEAAFNLDRESNTLALIFRDHMVLLALQSREILIKWQVRLTNQFEEGQQFSVHLVSAPKKGKLTPGPVKIHLQNQKFSLTSGIPPLLIHTWNMIDLRRYGSVEGGRFCFEGGTRCGKGEGLHVFRVDNSEELQIAFDLASKGKLENRKRSHQTNYTVSHSPSISSSLSAVHSRSGDSGESGGSGSPLITNTSFTSVKSRDGLQRQRSRSRSRSMNTSGGWSSLDNGLALSSPDTLSLTLSDVEQETRVSSPEHLVSRRTILDRIGLLDSGHSRSHNGSRSCGSESDFYLNWNVDRSSHPRRQGSVPWSGSHWNGTNGQGTWNSATSPRTWNGTMDRMSLSSGESQSSGSNYDQPKTVLKVTTSPKGIKRIPSRSSRPISPCDSTSPPLTPRSLRRVLAQQGGELELRRQIAAAPCGCGAAQTKEAAAKYQTYDVPRNLAKQDGIQFYDTPRNIREALAISQDGMGNYAIPGEPLPVFTKPCGCLMKLTSGPVVDREMTWTCIREGGNEESEIKIPRVKLTGQGRMPVVDMSKINAIRCFSEPPKERDHAQSLDLGRPTSPTGLRIVQPCSGVPVYAQIDRSKKQCPGCQQQIPHRCTKQQQQKQPDDQTNYTNLDFAQSLCLYENSKDVLSKLNSLTQSTRGEENRSQNYLLRGEEDASQNYLQMKPKTESSRDYELMNYAGGSSPPASADQPLFPPVYESYIVNAADCAGDRSSLCSSNYDTTDSMALMSDSRFDTIKLAPKNFVKIDNETCMYKPKKDPVLELSVSLESSSIYPDLGGVSHQSSNLQAELSGGLVGSNLYSGYVTIPRSRVTDNIHYTAKSQSSPGVTMRRSASVPCKRDRDSISSGGSDSGVSTGSPRQSTLDQLDSLQDSQLDSPHGSAPGSASPQEYPQQNQA